MSTAARSSGARHRTFVIGAVYALIAAPAVVTAIEAAHFHLRNRTNGSVFSDGEERAFLLHVPNRYDGTRPVPLLISMHGGGAWPALQMDLSGWNRVADEYGFLVVYPAGRGKPRRWETFEPGAALERDVRYIAALIDSLRAAFAIDSTRIYADGLSNGGGMAFVLSCTLADRIAAIGMVAPAQTLSPVWCPDRRPMPMIAFHGDADPILPYHGGPMGGPGPVRPVFRPVRAFVAWWAERNRCAATPVDTAMAADVVRLRYTECAEGAPVVFHTLLGGGHTWPGGSGLPEWFTGPTVRSIDATNEMWEFFRRHRLRAE